MLDSFFRKATRYLDFYQDFVCDWWNSVTYWQYVGLMVIGLLAGAMMLTPRIQGFK